jgi:hypothetical protein
VKNFYNKAMLANAFLIAVAVASHPVIKSFNSIALSSGKQSKNNRRRSQDNELCKIASE